MKTLFSPLSNCRKSNSIDICQRLRKCLLFFFYCQQFSLCFCLQSTPWAEAHWCSTNSRYNKHQTKDSYDWLERSVTHGDISRFVWSTEESGCIVELWLQRCRSSHQLLIPSTEWVFIGLLRSQGASLADSVETCSLRLLLLSIFDPECPLKRCWINLSCNNCFVRDHLQNELGNIPLICQVNIWVWAAGSCVTVHGAEGPVCASCDGWSHSGNFPSPEGFILLSFLFLFPLLPAVSPPS